MITKRFEDEVEVGLLKPVKVKILEVSWLHDNIKPFYKYMSERPTNVFEIESI